MSQFTLSIDTDNAAFGDDASHEVSRLLDEASEQMKNGFTSGYLRDVNGNSVGHWSL